MTPTQRLLTAARDYIAEKPEHWCQGELGFRYGETSFVYDGAVCAEGAICRAIDMAALPEVGPPHGECIRALRSVLDDQNVAAWNDAPGRTRDEVVAAFDRAIELAGETA